MLDGFTLLTRYMKPGVRILTVLAVSGIAVCALSVGAANAHPADDPHTHTGYQDGFAEREYPTEQSVLPATDLSLSLLSFAVGVGACLLVVRAMLPTLVRANCAEIVRHYVERGTPETGVKVVVIDRDSPRGGQASPDSAIETTLAGRHVRVDGASTTPAPSQVKETPGNVETQSILGRVYEQNVRLRDQLRAQADRIHP